jgi:site-specific DNA recombinase
VRWPTTWTTPPATSSPRTSSSALAGAVRGSLPCSRAWPSQWPQTSGPGARSRPTGPSLVPRPDGTQSSYPVFVSTTASRQHPAGEPMQVAIYCRLSLDRDQSGFGVQRQETECREYAIDHGWEVSVVYVDNDISATSGKRRPAFEAVLADHPPALLVWNLDRLARVSKDLERVLQLGVNVYALQAGLFDLSTPTGRAVARTVTAWATYEGEIRTERQRSAYRQRAKAGGRGWTNRPFGYELDGTLREPEAALVRQAYTEVLLGTTTVTIARTWNEAGMVGHFGRPFTPRTVKQTLVNARNAGLKVYDGEIVSVGDWTPIVDEPTWRGAQAVLTDPQRSRNKRGGNRVSSLLSGIATCADCGRELKIVRTDQMRTTSHEDPTRWVAVRKYGCQAGHMSVAQDWLDSVAIFKLQDALPQHMEAWTGPNERGEAERALTLRAELAAIGDKLNELAEAFAADQMTMEQVTAATRKLQERRTRAEEELAALTTEASAAEWVRDLEAFFAMSVELDLDRLRAMVSGVFRSIIVPKMGKGRYNQPKKELVTFVTRRGLVSDGRPTEKWTTEAESSLS